MKNPSFLVIAFLTAALFFPAFSHSQEDEPLRNEIIVTASLIPTEFAKTSRKVTVLDRDDLRALPAQSIADLLKFGAGVDLQPRAPFGIQGDISIRGTTFNQVLVMINGIKVYDPQTAHHNLDIPVPLSQIDRIEILHGPGSSLFGENAFGGIINIVTKPPGAKKLSGEFLAGQHKTVIGNLTWTFPLSGSTHSLAADFQNSEGFAPNRDFEHLTFSSNSHLKSLLGETDFTLGFSTKEFGAANFYAPFPSREWTDTVFSGLTHQWKKTKLKAYLRSHADRFVLDIDRPGYYENEHTSRSYGIELSSLLSFSSNGEAVFGGEFRADSIKSSALGDHSSTKVGVFTEWHQLIAGRLSMNAGFRMDAFSSFGLKAATNFSASILFSQFKLRASTGWAYRIPSYTELYYQSPANMGNPGLAPESSLSIDAGLDFFFGSDNLIEATVFFRKDKNLIDWVKEEASSVWQARNIRLTNVSGLETSLRLHKIATLGYTFIHSTSSIPPHVQSKYVMNHPVHQINVLSQQPLPLGLKAGIGAVFKKRKGKSGTVVLDCKLTRSFGEWDFFIQVTNLFDTSYEEIPGVSMPGRWVMAGLNFFQ